MANRRSRNNDNIPHHYWDATLTCLDTGSTIRYRRIGPASSKLMALRMLLSNQYFPKDVLRPYHPASLNISISQVETYE